MEGGALALVQGHPSCGPHVAAGVGEASVAPVPGFLLLPWLWWTQLQNQLPFRDSAGWPCVLAGEHRGSANTSWKARQELHLMVPCLCPATRGFLATHQGSDLS